MDTDGLDILAYKLNFRTITIWKGIDDMIMRMNPGWLRHIQLCLLCICVAVALMSGAAIAAEPQKKTKAAIPGLLLTETPQKPPLIVFYDRDGSQQTLAQFKGKLLVVNLWATWCVPCVAEMPSLSRLQSAMDGRDFAVIAVNQDRDDAAAARFYDKLNIKNLPVYTDPRNVSAKQWDVPGLPATFIVDPFGREVARLFGSTEWDAPEMQAFLETHLPPSASLGASGM